MKGITRHLVPPVCVVGLVAMLTALPMGVCAAQSVQFNLVYRPTMTPPVLVLFNEGAAAFDKGDLPKAQEKYQAALEKALGDGLK